MSLLSSSLVFFCVGPSRALATRLITISADIFVIDCFAEAARRRFSDLMVSSGLMSVSFFITLSFFVDLRGIGVAG
jgi:hypothetical protein